MEVTVRDPKAARRGIRRQRTRRLAAGLNVLLATALAVVLLVMLNYLAYRHYWRWDISQRDYYTLSPKTQSLVGSLPGPVEVVMFCRNNHPLYEDMKALMAELRYEADQHDPVTLSVTLVDPDRDLAQVRELKQRFDVGDVDTVLVAYEDRVKYVEASQMLDYQVHLTDKGPEKKLTGFRGEEMVASAIQSVAQKERPVVYFLSGHGERALTDTSKQVGLSTLGRAIVHDNVELFTLVLTRDTQVPEDCAALVIVGPDRTFTQPELDMLGAYAEKGGRMLMLLDPLSETGLEPLLERWNVKLQDDVVVGLTLTGRETLIMNYGVHPVTRNFVNVTTMFYRPRSVGPLVTPDLKAGPVPEDRPLVTVLGLTGPEGWAETDLEQEPPKFDKEKDRPGPIPVAVAVERGAVPGIELAIQPTRMVIFGDSYFVSNGALATGMGGNRDLFMSALNWLLERDSLLEVGPRVPGELRLDMTNHQLRAAYLVIGLGLPAGIAILGFMVWLRRRQ
jgi:ABC-type uncharacterized transport system involved in gliding motility auxiliary subunit